MDRLAVRTVTNATPSGTTHFIDMLGGGGDFDTIMPGLGAMTGGLANRVIAETDGAGVSRREYIWLDNQVVAVIDDANTTNPTPYWVTNDNLGRPVQMTDADRAVVWRAKYRPFGGLISVAGPASLDARFPGQWFQLESGLSYNWHRYYDATLGRYTQPDPLGWIAGPSLYAYVNGDPVNLIDPLGLAGWNYGPPPPGMPGGPYTLQRGQRPGTYMGPKQPQGGTRSMCRGVPPTDEGGPPGTPAPYWKYTPPGGGPVQKFDINGNPLLPGDQGHAQDDWKGGRPPSSAPGEEEPPITPDDIDPFIDIF
ncbi:RHS domain-containing protein [Jiella sp. MQZ9-1]|uniref:RHS domain-containing protein n=1 Tax=Jiella flava TaxID=2816857 RepID=A0A939JXY1_9HYPH|nr:RHS repeat-associated core domain-containing protein [Jiella flava]MBO0664567.1 RHS domain-containing protein [Jiella flava]MCD2473200.1 RHS domain-containing protein [Jiella flava]